MQIEKIRLDLLKPYPNNAKIHTDEQVEQIVASIREFGFNDPVAIDENNMIIEGHGRVLALRKIGETEVDAIRLAGLNDEQKRAYIHIHNQLTMNTGFDMELLETELKNITSIDMGQFGFDLDFDVEMHPEDFDDGEPAGSQEPTEPRSKRGQVWQCGKHRLMCGDSTSAADVRKLTEGREMDLLVTDPPYGVSYQENGSASEARARHRNQNMMSIENDDLEGQQLIDFLIAAFEQARDALKPGGAFYIWHAGVNALSFRSACAAVGLEIRQNLIWVKNTMVLGRQDYQWKHEPCLYGWKDGAGHYFTNDRCQTTVFENRPDLESMDREQLLQTAQLLLRALDQANASVIHEKKPAKSEIHPTMKPVPLIQRLVQNSSRRGERVLDLFGGSGSTMLACQNCGRVAYLMELDPKYCDAILNRWETETGERAVLLSD